MNIGIVFLCDPNGIVLHVYRDDFGIFGTSSNRQHLSRYLVPRSKAAATRFFSALSSIGLSASSPIEFVIQDSPLPLFCIGMRIRNCFLLFGAADLFNLGALISGTLYSDDVPVDLSLFCGTDISHEVRTLPDYKIYEDLTRLNNELVDMSRQLADTQVKLEMEAEERNKEIHVRIQVEEALRQANKQLNLLSDITRHDIINQLFALKGYLELSYDVIDKPENLREYIKKEQQAANTIEHQITFTKDYQKLGAAAPAWQKVNESITKAVAGLPMRAVHIEPDPADPEVYADALFDKVFYNLIDNALKYGGDQMKTIRVSSRETDTGLTIICEDDGVGISAEDKKRLFTRGFGKNTGLGLFLSREILAITGITITENGVPGKGARFEIAVPKGMWRMAGKEK